MVKQQLSEVDPISPPNVTGEQGEYLTRSASTHDDKLGVRKTCQRDLKSQKMNVCQLSPVQNMRGPPQGFQRGLHSGEELACQCHALWEITSLATDNDKLRPTC